MNTTKAGFCLIVFIVMTVNDCFPLQIQQEFPEYFSVKVSNPLNTARENVLVFIPADKVRKGFNPNAFIILDQDKEIPAQYNTEDPNRKGIVTVLDKMNPSEIRQLFVRYKKSGVATRNYKARTQAELSPKTGGKFVDRKYIGGDFSSTKFLRVPPEHKDHSYYIRYEGPGWESDKVGYRFYLDQRNAVDVFGKLTTDLVLHQVGLDGFESYHKMQPWGMDVMKVGNSLGLGSIGMLVNGEAVRIEKTDSVTCQVSATGPVYSSLFTKYFGWEAGAKKYNVVSEISIHAGTRVSQQHLEISGGPEEICTGLIKDKNALLITTRGDSGHFGYLATYGKQSLNNDELGLAVFFKANELVEFTSDENNHIVRLKPTQGKIDYYFLATWIKEPNGIQHNGEFLTYLYKVAEELANPVKVEIIK